MSKLQLLACKNCGASLSDPPEAGVLVCKYCDHRHAFDATPPPRNHAAPIHGHMPGPPMPMGPPVGYSAPGAHPRGGQSAFIFPLVGIGLVVVLGTAMAMFTMRPASSSSTSSPVVTTAATSNEYTKGASYREGEAVRIHWGSTWWDGKIVEVKADDQYEISYDGYSASSNEVVGIERLQKTADAEEDDRANKKRRNKSKK